MGHGPSLEEPSDCDLFGREPAGCDSFGREPAGCDLFGREPAGCDLFGREPAGCDLFPFSVRGGVCKPVDDGMFSFRKCRDVDRSVLINI